MKKVQILAVLCSLFLLSCSDRKGKSDAYGTFEATEITISAEVPGKLTRFTAEEGKILKAEDTVGLIDTVDWHLKRSALLEQRLALQSRLAAIAAQKEVQVQQKDNLLIEKDRIEKLLKDKAATPKQMDDMTGAIKVVDKQIQATEVQNQGVTHEMEAITQQMAQVEETLHKCYIVNPIDGMVLARYMENDELAAAGKPLYKIADLREMYLRVYISGSQLPHVKLGDEVEVLIDEDKTRNRSLQGTVSWIASSAEFTPKIIQTKEERVNLVYAVKVKVKNDGSLKIAMPGEVKFKHSVND